MAAQPVVLTVGCPGLLQVEGLSVAFNGENGPVEVAHALDLTVNAGETVAIVGEPGSGKFVTALAITRLLDHTGGRITSGTIQFTDKAGQVRDLAQETTDTIRHLRGPELAMVFQAVPCRVGGGLRYGVIWGLLAAADR
jgi:glutathione transport system ATP-binding protein